MPESTNFIPVAKPLLGDEELQAVARPIQSGWVSQGPEVASFEQEFAKSVGAKHAALYPIARQLYTLRYSQWVSSQATKS